nr:retrovirus-related Pol polyprotein from transposon TNT 1-94 [Tanacetum cinerariifolium]
MARDATVGVLTTIDQLISRNRIVRNGNGTGVVTKYRISICQEKYTKDLLKKYEISNISSVKTLMVPPYNLSHDLSDKPIKETLYRGMIGSLMYPTEMMGYYFYFPPENKIIVAMYTEFLERNLLSQEISERAEELEEIQNKDTSPSKNTSEIPMELEGFEPPQEEVVLIRRSARTHQALDCLCLNVEVEEHSLGDLNEPNNYKAAILDLESDKWVDAMNTIMKSIKDINSGDWLIFSLMTGIALSKVLLQCLLHKMNDIAASEGAMKVVWIKKFILRLGTVPTINVLIKMFFDNSVALLIANEPRVQRGARHYHKRYHYVRECIELGKINLLKVHTDDNLADPFTKALSKGKLT